MAFNTEAFLSEITNGVALDDSTKAALQNALANPQISKRLEESTLRQSDYSKKLTEYNDKLKKSQDYWDSLVSWDRSTKAKLESEVTTLRQKLANDGVSLDDSNGEPRGGTDQKEELKKLAQESLAYMNTITKLGLNHYKEFGEVLDTDKLIERATRENTNIMIAYDREVQPKREDLQKADIEKQLAQAREEGKAEALKNVQIPSAEQPFSSAMPSALDSLNKTAEARGTEFGTMAAVKAWKENRQKNNPLPF